MATQPKINIQSLHQTTESIFKLLGGSPDDRLRFWEILKGITTPAVSTVLQSQIRGMDAQFKAIHDQLSTLQERAKELGTGH